MTGMRGREGEKEGTVKRWQEGRMEDMRSQREEAVEGRRISTGRKKRKRRGDNKRGN